MKTARLIPLILLLTACAHRHHSPSPSPADGPGQVLTEADAIAVVLAKIQGEGGDPAREECSAQKTENGWRVIDWHIWYPAQSGSSRFVPGGFTTYLLGDDGKILKKIPGH